MQQQRQPFYATSAAVLAAAETGRIDGYVAAHSVTTLFDLAARGRSADEARMIVADVLRFLRVAGVSQTTIEGALALPFRDFEDAVQMVAAVEVGAGYLITRDLKEYRGGPIPTLRPAELLALLRAPEP